MSKNNGITRLPESIVIPQLTKDAEKELRQGVGRLQVAYGGLQAVEEVHPIPTLQEINADWLRERISHRVELVEADPSLTEFERQNRLQAWKAIRTEATMHTNAICKVLEDWPEAEWVFDNKENNYNCANIESVARSRATHATSTQAQDHWKLIQQTLDLIKNLREWENENDIVWRPLINYLEMTTQAFAEMWATGGAKFNHDFDRHLGRAGVRNANNTKHLII